MTTQHHSVSNCDDSLCRICWPDEDFTNYSECEPSFDPEIEYCTGGNRG